MTLLFLSILQMSAVIASKLGKVANIFKTFYVVL